MRIAGTIAGLIMMMAMGCQFSEYAQAEKLTENIDEHRTGCEIDADKLLEGYKQWDANRWSFSDDGDPTPTPAPVTDAEVAARVFLETIWEHGCATGRRDVVGAEQTTLMGLQDKLDILGEQIAALQPTPTPTPTN